MIDFRNELYNYANDINADFSNMNDCDKNNIYLPIQIYTEKVQKPAMKYYAIRTFHCMDNFLLLFIYTTHQEVGQDGHGHFA